MTKSISIAALVALLLIPVVSLFSQTKNDKMKIEPSQAAPAFVIKDINGVSVNLADYKGKKIMLSFYRNVGCPICNLRFHELQEQADYFKSKGLILLAVYESSSENMREYLEGERFYATMIPNPDLSLYKLYKIEKGMGKVMKGMFHGAMGKMKKGKKLFHKKIKQDGSSSRISADFLIDENGNIKTAYYGKFVGDHLPMADIKSFVN
jgi:thioredoxin-dependent peroxiredoxin